MRTTSRFCLCTALLLTPVACRSKAGEKVRGSRQQLFKEGALARKLVDDAHVAYALAKGQFDTAQLHFTALQQVAKAEQTNVAAAQVAAAKGHYEAAEAQVGYSQ